MTTTHVVRAPGTAVSRHGAFVLAALASVTCIACGSADAPTDAGPVDGGSAPRDAGPRAEEFVEIGGATEGIALGRNADDEPVLYVGAATGRILEIDADAQIREIAEVDGPLGIAWRSDGTLLVCGKDDDGDPAVLTVTREGEVATLVDRGPADALLVLPNFVAIAPDGSIVFSDTMTNSVLRADADGANVALVTDAVPGPNGLAFSPDGATLYVAAWSGEGVLALSFDRATSVYGAPELHVDDVSNVDGLVATSDGRLVLTTSGTGVLLATPESSDPPTALLGPRAINIVANGAFGAGELGSSTLYLTAFAGRSVFRIETDLEGVPLPTP